MSLPMTGDFEARVAETERCPLRSLDLDTIQVNLGLTCNLKCVHCHVAAGPKRTEQMDWATMEHVLDAVRGARCRLVDITGGAPEMNPHFRRFMEAITEEGVQAQVRTNLTILLESGYEDLPGFLAQHGVWLVASLPCYLQENVDAQRGQGVYEGSIRALLALNAVGYGVRENLPLVLVYNPQGPALPPPQAGLEADYKRELHDRFGVHFTRLITIANMPIGRFWNRLRLQKKEAAYLDLLKNTFNPHTLSGLMCRHLVSVDWNGRIYDCDFNLALKMPVNHGIPNHIAHFDPATLAQRPIATGPHCFGCTAGAGSSCSGALA